LVLYAFLCHDAINQRGYPPLEAHWQGMTLVWLVGVPFSGLFESFTRRRVYCLIAYALATGFVDAASWPMMVPNRFDPFYCAVATVIFYGPIHLVITAILEGATRALDWWARPRSRRLSRLGRPVAAALLLLAAALLPSAYATYDRHSMDVGGRSRASIDWAGHQAVIYRKDWPADESIGDIRIEIHVDRATGLLLHSNFHHGFENSYNQEIARLLAQRGVPPWGEPAIPAAEQLVKMLDATGFTAVTTFPATITPNIILMRGGTLNKWGGTMSSGSTDLTVATPNGLFGVGGNSGSAFTYQNPAFPNVIFVREGQGELAVFDSRGEMLATVSKWSNGGQTLTYQTFHPAHTHFRHPRWR
jgi:hypothetical protein